MSKKTTTFFSFFLLLSIIFVSGCGCKQSSSNYSVKLEVWGLFDDSDVMTKALDEYKKKNPQAKEIVYKKLTVDSYESDLLDALATGKGPDVFLIHNTWLLKHQDKLAPAPVVTSNSAQSEFLPEKQVRDAFVDVVSQDFVKDSKVYALPMSVDSLALYYNKDILNQAGIVTPPATWLEFDEDVKKITKMDTFGNILTSGAAMGMSSDTSSGEGKINRATDILTLLMMQAGTEMNSSKNNLATFSQFSQTTSGKKIAPGQEALNYYTKFSNRGNEEYCWNSLMHNSVDSFIEGKTAMILNYSWLISKIEAKAPKLNFGISAVPQNKNEDGKGPNVDFANYWGFAVSKNKVQDSTSPGAKASASDDQRILEAWKLNRFLTMKPVSSGATAYDPASEYVANQKKPAARRDLLEKQKNDVWLSPFAQGNLIAKNWTQPDNLAVEKIFDEMIDDVVLRNKDSRETLIKAENSVNLLFKK